MSLVVTSGLDTRVRAINKRGTTRGHVTLVGYSLPKRQNPAGASPVPTLKIVEDTDFSEDMLT